MTSPPVLVPVNRQDTGTPRGNSRKAKVTEGDVRTATHAERFGTGRVMLQDTWRYRKGETIRTRLTYALRAPNGLRVPIPDADFWHWTHTYYEQGRNKKGFRAFYASKLRGMFDGIYVEDVPLKCGSWMVLQSDEDFAVIPQMHTRPLEVLEFSISDNGAVVASFPEKETTPAAEKFGDSTSYEGSH